MFSFNLLLDKLVRKLDEKNIVRSFFSALQVAALITLKLDLFLFIIGLGLLSIVNHYFIEKLYPPGTSYFINRFKYNYNKIAKSNAIILQLAIQTCETFGEHKSKGQEKILKACEAIKYIDSLKKDMDENKIRYITDLDDDEFCVKDYLEQEIRDEDEPLQNHHFGSILQEFMTLLYISLVSEGYTIAKID